MFKLKIQNSKRKTTRQNLKFLLLTCSFTFLLFTFTFLCFAQDKIVAVVNHEVITEKDLNDFISFMRMEWSRQYKDKELEEKIQAVLPELLNKLIEDRLILQEAERSKVIIDESRIKSQIAQIKGRYKSDSDFQNALLQQGLTQADIETKIREQLLIYNIIELKVKNKIVVSPPEVTEFYQQHTSDFKLPEQREFDLISIKDAGIIFEIAEKLRNGESFESVALEYIVSLNRATETREQLNKEIGDAVFKLKETEVSLPLESQDAYYIFKLNKIIPPRQQALAEVQGKIYAFLFNQKMQKELALWLDGLKKHSYIKITQN